MDAAIAEYEANGDVEYAEPNYTYHASWTPNDYYFNNGVQYAPQKVSAQSAWDITRGSSSTKIAILDTGLIITIQT